MTNDNDVITQHFTRSGLELFLDDSWEPVPVQHVRATAPVRASISVATPRPFEDDVITLHFTRSGLELLVNYFNILEPRPGESKVTIEIAYLGDGCARLDFREETRNAQDDAERLSPLPEPEQPVH